MGDIGVPDKEWEVIPLVEPTEVPEETPAEPVHAEPVPA
jgi:hypothetical protein